jgi:hypothetical protein
MRCGCTFASPSASAMSRICWPSGLDVSYETIRRWERQTRLRKATQCLNATATVARRCADDCRTRRSNWRSSRRSPFLNCAEPHQGHRYFDCRRKCSLTFSPYPPCRLHRSKPLSRKDWLTKRQGWRSAVVVRKPRTLPAVAETDAEDTGSAAESANRALHHLRNLGDGRASLRMRLQRAHVFFRPRFDDATCRLRLHRLGGVRALNSLIQSSRHYFRYSI